MTPEAIAICVGFDAMRIALGHKPVNFTVAEVMRWLRTMAREGA